MRRLIAFTSIACLFAATLTLAADEEKPRRKPEQAKPTDLTKLLEQYDKNKDGFLDLSEVPEQLKQRFERVDVNSDGKLSKEELEKVAGRLTTRTQRPAAAATPDTLFRALDANGDGKLSKEELQNAAKLLEKLDKNKDGVLDKDELPAAPARRERKPD